MCRSPLHIVNPSRWIDPNSSQRLFIDVPCGHCSECRKMQQSEWLLRLYYEQLRAFKHGEYCLFDTLTYDNEHLPHLRDELPDLPCELDFPCFSIRDVQLFLKRLRKRFKVSFRYFLAAEYGADQCRTRRPHWHCIFFVPSSIDVFDFSLAISSSWKNGRTDGIPFKPFSYVNGNVFTAPSPKISNYVIKYVTKSSSYNSLVLSRLDQIRQFDSSLVDRVKKFVRMRHLQSLGFGYSYLLSVLTPSKLASMTHIQVVDKDKFSYVSLPLSLRRKAFYDYHVIDGRVVFVPNSHLKEFNDYRVADLVNRLKLSFHGKLTVEECTVLADYILFRRDRFVADLDPASILSDQYNTDSRGLRNYSAVDRPFKQRCFLPFDIGSDRDGYSIGNVVDPISLDFLAKQTFVDDSLESELMSYYASRCDDPALDVDKVVDRVKNLLKSLNYV